MSDDYILFDNKDDLITRYVISECSCVLDDREIDDLCFRCIVEKAKTLTEEVKGVFGTLEEAIKELSKYETMVLGYEDFGVSSFEVRQYYIFERQFNIERAMQENKDITSEEDFDKLLQTDYLRMSNYVVDDTDMNWRAVTRFSDNQRDELARKHLYSKMTDELRSYTEDLERASAEDIIRRSYETVMKNELICLFYPDEKRYSLDEIRALRSCDNPLDTLYHRWLDIDVNLNEVLEDTVGDIVSDLTETTEKYDMLNGTKSNDNVKIKL